MSTHAAVVTASVRGNLEVIQVPTIKPTNDEVLVKVEWTTSGPLELHQNDGGLLVNHPQVLGDGLAGTVLEIGPDAKRLKVGDKVCATFLMAGEKVVANLEIGIRLFMAYSKRKGTPRTRHCIRIPPRHRSSLYPNFTTLHRPKKHRSPSTPHLSRQ